MGERHLDISLRVNGEDVRERVEARKTLVDFLREDLGLTGSHIGCEPVSYTHLDVYKRQGHGHGRQGLALARPLREQPLPPT